MSGFGRMIRVGNGLAISFLVSRDGRPETWIWTVRPQATPGPGGLIDKGASGLRLAAVVGLVQGVFFAGAPPKPRYGELVTPDGQVRQVAWRHPVPQRHGHHAR
jgi:hypothetical protein